MAHLKATPVVAVCGVVPVVRYNAREITWHIREQSVVAICGAVPVATI